MAVVPQDRFHCISIVTVRIFRSDSPIPVIIWLSVTGTFNCPGQNLIDSSQFDFLN